jgi:hypothetical protein
MRPASELKFAAAWLFSAFAEPAFASLSNDA